MRLSLKNIFAVLCMALLGINFVSPCGIANAQGHKKEEQTQEEALLTRLYALTEKAERAKHIIEACNVAENWEKGRLIIWETGKALPKEAHYRVHTANQTHAGAFVAAVCKKLKLSRKAMPPCPSGKEVEVDLASKQNAYYHGSKAAEAGWQKIEGSTFQQRYIQAAIFANSGYLVVASLKASNPKHPGHTSIVLPHGYKGNEIPNLLVSGPLTSQAAVVNSASVSLKNGYADYPKAFSEKGGIEFFRIAIP